MKTATFSESQRSVERRVSALLQPLFADRFRVIYDPAFPRQDGSTFAWFQVVFAVGPAGDADARAHVHVRFAQLLAKLASLPEAQRSDTVSFRARRHVPPRTTPDHPHMFIECDWHGAAVSEIQRTNSFSAWHLHCHSYVNRFDSHDPLNTDTRRA